MKFELAKFKAGLKRCIGIVNVEGNLEILKTFYLKPNIKKNEVHLVGSDGGIKLLDKIECEFEEGDNENVLILQASKIYNIVKCATEDISIKDSENSAVIISGTKKWTINKEDKGEYGEVSFEKYFEVKEFKEEFDAEKFLFIIERLASNINKPNEINPMHKQLYINDKNAYASTRSFMTIAKMEEIDGNYVFQEAIIRRLRDLLREYKGKVCLTDEFEEVAVIIKSDTFLFVYNNKAECKSEDINFMKDTDSIVLENAIVMERSKVSNLINSAKITSEDKSISISIELGECANGAGGKFTIHSEETNGGEFDGVTDILKYKRRAEEIKDNDKTNPEDTDISIIKSYKCTISIEDFYYALKIIKSEHIILRYSTYHNLISISDETNSYRSIIAI